MNVTCPNCATVYRVDPAKIPDGGVRARCSICSAVFAVSSRSADVEAVAAAGPAPLASQPAAGPGAPAGRGGDSSEPLVSPAAATAPPSSSATVPPPIAEAPRPAAGPTAPAAPPSSRPAAWPAGGPPRPATPDMGGAGRDAFGSGRAPTLPPPAVPVGGARPAAPPSPPPAAPPPLAVPRPAAGGAVPAGVAPLPPAPPATPAPATPPAAAPRPPLPAARPAGGTGSRPVNPFLSQDPALKARRLARALISDMVVYHPAKRQEGLRDGNLKELFDEEIRKSWEEYADQVGQDVADSTPYFKEALNEILAGGRQIF